MLETPHVALGAAIAIKTGNPWLAIPLAFTSHFFLEMVPHWNPHLNTEMKTHGRLTNKTLFIIALDLTSAIILTYILAKDNIYIYMACFASILPDLIEGPYFFLGVKNKFLMWWLKTQKALQSDASPFWGILTQIITLGATLYWIFN